MQLRRGLLLGEIKPVDFASYAKELLIPASFKEMREKSQKKYFEENVNIASDKPILAVMKSHKGEETV